MAELLALAFSRPTPDALPAGLCRTANTPTPHACFSLDAGWPDQGGRNLRGLNPDVCAAEKPSRHPPARNNLIGSLPIAVNLPFLLLLCPLRRANAQPCPGCQRVLPSRWRVRDPFIIGCPRPKAGFFFLFFRQRTQTRIACICRLEVASRACCSTCVRALALPCPARLWVPR